MVDRSGKTPLGVDTNGRPTGSAPTKNPITNSYTDLSSWIAWQRVTDIATGVVTTATDDENITYSAIAQYMGQRPTLTSWNGANGLPLSTTMAGGLERVFQCPADPIASRPNILAAPFYRFSYAMSDMVSYSYGQKSLTLNGVSYGVGQRNDFKFTGRLASVKHPQSVIWFICEDEQTIDDAIYIPQPWLWATPGKPGIMDLLAGRHTSGYTGMTDNYTSLIGGKGDVQGNVSFVDGHAGILGRKDALRQQYTGSPAPDPAPGSIAGW
jgi:prepilin-type processing-associated H-X9-DG protein